MKCVVTINDTDYELPKKTLGIAKLFDAARSAATSEASYRKQYELVSICLGKDATAEILDGTKLEDIDIVALSMAFLKIEQAYVSPVEAVTAAFEQEKANNAMFDKVIELGDSVNKISGFVENATKH